MATEYKLGTELRLISYIIGLYVTFIYWGYLQEKVTTSKYQSTIDDSILEWKYPFVLNFIMACFAFIASSLIQLVSSSNVNSFSSFVACWKAGLTCSLASPVGYASLKYITFPLMVLTKSSKPIPVMLVGILLYGRKFPWYKYVSVLLVCCGIALFSSGKSSSSDKASVTVDSTGNNSGNSDGQWNTYIGIGCVLINLVLDGYTNNEQDEVFEKRKISPVAMMGNANGWQVIFISLYLIVSHFIHMDNSELSGAYDLLLHSTLIRYDIFLFCVCAVFGQILIFSVMKEFGSLVWITISITRKLFTILISIFMFNHKVKMIQWGGIILVFTGLTLESYMGYHSKKIKKVETKKDQ